MSKRSLRAACLAGSALAVVVGLGHADVARALISGASVNFNPGNSADNFQDGVFAGFERRSTAAIATNNGTTLATRYAFVNGTDTGIATDQSNSQTCDYRVQFNVTAPGAYRLTVNTARRGALTRVDDLLGDNATADISGVAASYTGSGTFTGGPLTLPDPPASSGSGNANTPFDASTAVATVTGISNGAAIPQRFDFSWTTFCNSDSTSIFTGGDECAVRGGIAISYSGETAGDYPGVGSRVIGNDGHFLTVAFESLCGNSVVEGAFGEQCDEGVANGTSGSCCAANCTFRAMGEECRPSAGDCDVAEECTGSSSTCPTDGFEAPGVVCRAASPGQVCDFEETCTGGGPNCPVDFPQPNGTICRPSMGVCDLTETCDGVSNFCPPDVKSTAVCRPQNGVCDVADSCDGVNDDCPADGFASAATPCRPAVDVCDMAENCPGNGPNCPADQAKPSGTSCPADGNPCTADECDGASTACQHPAGNAGTQCRASASDCDVAEQCDGASTTCPPDEFEPSTTVCRAASPGELCDATEFCPGGSPNCPADDVLPMGTVCRPSAGVCDVAESCDGGSKLCPTDGFQPDGTSCADALFCNGAEECLGGTCQSGALPCGVGQSCEESTDECFTGGCPNNAVVCRMAQKAILVIKDKTDNTRDRLVWKWIKGANTTQAEFADPTMTANYALCFYSGPTASLIGNADVGPGSNWSPISTKGFKYKDLSAAQSGVKKIVLKGSDNNKSKALVKGKGDGLPDLPLPIPMGDLPLIVQLRNNESGVCWEGVFDSPLKNRTDLFKDKTP
jgi:Disintegrin